MNLDQLALQCYEECGDYHLGSVSQFNHKKFAELIVRECCNAADDWYQNANDIHWDPAQHIRSHFGVE